MKLAALPKIHSVSVKIDPNDDVTWQFFFCDFMRPNIFNGEEFSPEILQQLNEFKDLIGEQPLLTVINYRNIEYLLGVDNELKQIRLATVQMGYELALKEWIEKSGDWCKSLMDNEDQEEIDKLNAHLSFFQHLQQKPLPGIIEQISAQGNLIKLWKPSEEKWSEVNQKSQSLSQKLIQILRQYHPSFIERISDFALNLTANYALFRIHLLKFVAIMPSLDWDHSGVEVKRIFVETFRRMVADSQKAASLGRTGVEGPIPVYYEWLFNMAYGIGKLLPPKIVADIIRFKIRFMAKRFIAGENIDTADEALRKILDSGRFFTVDQLGELVVSEKEADYYCKSVLELIDGMSRHIPEIGSKNKADIYKANVSIKVSALCSDFKPFAFDYTYDLVAPRLKKILIRAKEKKVFLNVDAEHHHFRDLVLQIYEKVLIETPELRDYQQTGVVVQAYLRDGYKHLRDV